LQSIVNYYGGSVGLEVLRERSGTNKQGTTLLGLWQAAQETGFTAVANLEIEVDSTSLVVFEQDILFKNDSTFVEVLNKEQKKEKIAILTGTSDGIRTAVVYGVDTSSLIVKQ
jgi:ABC-type bacteriocin/lantibiotic exporter with double-glycine peptidase domain